MYCPKCGGIVPDNANNCPTCGASVTAEASAQTPIYVQPSGADEVPVQNNAQKSKVAAGLLGIFLGCFGAHNFYLGFKKKAIIQLVISLVGSFLFGVGPAVMAIWGIVEGVIYLSGVKTTDADGNQLV